MKKNKNYVYFIKLSEERHRKSIKRKGKHYSPQVDPVEKTPNKVVFGYKFIDAPDRICFYSADAENQSSFIKTIEFFNRLTNLRRKSKILIDFKHTSRVEAAAVIALYANIEKLIKTKDIKFRYSLPKDRTVRHQLRASYLFKLMNNSEIIYDFTNQEELPIITGIANDHVQSLVNYVMRYIYDGQMSPYDEYTFSDAIQETVNNVGLHAYPNKSDENKQWWLLCQVIDDQLFLAIYDSGVGIPKTIQGRHFFMSRLRHYYPSKYLPFLRMLGIASSPTLTLSDTDKLLTDSEAINLSMLPDATSTAEDKHGQGSKSIKKLVDENEAGRLWIFSNSGLYVKKQGQEPALKDLPIPITGTLVQWNINLNHESTNCS